MFTQEVGVLLPSVIEYAQLSIEATDANGFFVHSGMGPKTSKRVADNSQRRKLTDDEVDLMRFSNALLFQVRDPEEFVEINLRAVGTAVDNFSEDNGLSRLGRQETLDTVEATLRNGLIYMLPKVVLVSDVHEQYKALDNDEKTHLKGVFAHPVAQVGSSDSHTYGSLATTLAFPGQDGEAPIDPIIASVKEGELDAELYRYLIRYPELFQKYPSLVAITKFAVSVLNGAQDELEASVGSQAERLVSDKHGDLTGPAHEELIKLRNTTLNMITSSIRLARLTGAGLHYTPEQLEELLALSHESEMYRINSRLGLVRDTRSAAVKKKRIQATKTAVAKGLDPDMTSEVKKVISRQAGALTNTVSRESEYGDEPVRSFIADFVGKRPNAEEIIKQLVKSIKHVSAADLSGGNVRGLRTIKNCDRKIEIDGVTHTVFELKPRDISDLGAGKSRNINDIRMIVAINGDESLVILGIVKRDKLYDKTKTLGLR